MADANTLKDQGNKAFAAKDFDKAIELFTAAIAIDPSNHVLCSNRSAAKAGKKSRSAALEDAEKYVTLNPTWGKGYVRQGAALHGARRLDEAISAYEKGIQYEDSPSLRKGLRDVKDAQAKDAGAGPDLGLAKPFQDPHLIGKLAMNPRTQMHLADPAFVQKLQLMQQDPKLAESALSSDTRMIDVLGVAMGIDLQGFSRDEGSDDLAPGLQKTSSQPPPVSPPRRQFTPSSSTSNSKPTPPPPAPELEKEDIEMAKEEAEEAKAKADALAAKTKGSEYYKQRQFSDIASEFSKAWDIWPKDITFLVAKPPTRETPLTGVTDGTFASFITPPHYARGRKFVHQICKRLYVSTRSGLRPFWPEKNDGCGYERDDQERDNVIENLQL